MTASFHDFGFLGQGTYDHGTRKNYAAGCRCTPCRAAESAYQCQRARARAQGDTAWISADVSRAHVATLTEHGLGVRQIAALASISPRTVQSIRNGRPRITRAIEARILRVQPIPAGGALVNSYKTFDLIRLLLKEGYSEAQLMAWLNVDQHGLRRRARRVRASRAMRVLSLFRRLTAE